jgi:hypothetical protein
MFNLVSRTDIVFQAMFLPYCIESFSYIKYYFTCMFSFCNIFVLLLNLQN